MPEFLHVECSFERNIVFMTGKAKVLNGRNTVEAQCTRRSQLVHQIADTDVERLGNSHERHYAGGFFAPFQLANIDRVQISFLGQFFLTQLGTLSETANAFADNFLMSQGFGHAYSGKQEAAGKNTVNSPLF